MKRIVSLLIVLSIMMSFGAGLVYAEGDTSLASQYLFASAYSDKLETVVMAGRYGAALTSQDGVNFGRTYSGEGSYVIGNAGLEQVMWIDETEEFIVLDANNTNKDKTNIAVSDDGVEWTVYTDVTAGGSSVYLSCINYINGEYVAAGLGGNIYTSKNLETWTKVTETGILEAVDANYASAAFSGIVTSKPDINGRVFIAMYIDHATYGVKNNTNTFFFGDTDMGDDWYTVIEEIDTYNTKNRYNRIFDMAWSDNGYFYGVGAYGANGEAPFKFDPELKEMTRSTGSSYPFNAENGGKGTVSIIEDGDRYVIGTTTGKILSYPVSDSKAFSGVPTLTEITASSSAAQMASTERVYHFSKTKWGLLGAASKTTGAVLNIGESTYDTISTYYRSNIDSILTPKQDEELTPEPSVEPTAEPTAEPTDAPVIEGDTEMAVQYLNASAYSEKLGAVVMAGRYSAVLTSQDGVRFGRTYSGEGSYVIGNAGLEQVLWIDETEEFVVLNANNTNKDKTDIAVSKDGIKWTVYSDIKADGKSLYISCINYINGEYVAAGLGGNIYTSKNLETWTKVTETGVLEAVNADYANALFSGIVTSTPDENGRVFVVMYIDHATYGVKNSTNTFFLGDTDMGDDWYTAIEEIDTYNTRNRYVRIFDVAWSDNGYFYGVGAYGANGEAPFKFDPELKEMTRSTGSTYPFYAENGGKGTVSIIEDGDRYVIGTTTGKILSYPVSDSKAFSGVPTLTEITASSSAAQMATTERIYHFVKTKWGLLCATGRTTGAIINVGEKTYDAITTYYKNNADEIFTPKPDREPTDEMVQVTKSVGMEYVKDMYDEYRTSCLNNIESVFETDPRRAAYTAALATMLHKHTNEATYLQDAKSIVDELLAFWSESAPSSANDFFTWGAFVEAYAYVRDAGEIENADSTVAEYVNSLAASNTGNDRHNTDNQSMLRARSLMVGAKKLNSSYTDSWNALVQEAFANVTELGATNENATGYNGLAIFAMCEIAEGMGYTVPKAILESFVHQVAPSGAMPEYGDDYFSSWYECLPVFMYYARKYNDGGVWYNADKLFHFGCNNYNIDRQTQNVYTMMMNLYYVAKAYETECTAENYKDPEYKSEITKKNTPYGEVNDKLILRNGNAFAYVDLYARGAHANHNSTGAVIYYERDSVPVYHGMARHNKSAEHFAMPIVTDSEELNIVKNPTEGEWYTESYPLTLLDPDGDGTADIKKLTLRLVPTEGEENLYIDNIRLTGKSGTLVLDNCDTAWTTRSGVFSVSDDVTSDGTGSIKISIQGQDTFSKYFYKTPVYNKSVALSDYDTISFDWSYATDSNSLDFDYIIRLENADEYIDFYANSINQMPTVKSAKVETRQDMEYAVVEFENYGGYGIELKREYALFSDGTLVVKNSFGEEIEGKYVHNIQQMYGNATMSGTTAVGEGEDKVWYDVTAHKAEIGETYTYMPNTSPSLIEIGKVTNSDIDVNALVFTKKLVGNDKLVTLISDTKQTKTGDCLTTDEAIIDFSEMTPGYAKATVNDDGSYNAYIKVKNDKNATVYIAEYDENGYLVATHIETANSADGIIEYTTGSYTKTGDTVKVFAWADNQLPVVWKN